MSNQTNDAIELVSQLNSSSVEIINSFNIDKELFSVSFLESQGFALQLSTLSSPSVLFVHPSLIDFLSKKLKIKQELPKNKVHRFENARFVCQWKRLLIYTTEHLNPETRMYLFHYNHKGIDYINNLDTNEVDVVINKNKINTISSAIRVNLV